jgi:hypothetical protein
VQKARDNLNQQEAHELSRARPILGVESPEAIDGEVRQRPHHGSKPGGQHVVDASQLDQPSQGAEVQRGGEQ